MDNIFAVGGWTTFDWFERNNIFVKCQPVLLLNVRWRDQLIVNVPDLEVIYFVTFEFVALVHKQ